MLHLFVNIFLTSVWVMQPSKTFSCFKRAGEESFFSNIQIRKSALLVSVFKYSSSTVENLLIFYFETAW